MRSYWGFSNEDWAMSLRITFVAPERKHEYVTSCCKNETVAQIGGDIKCHYCGNEINICAIHLEQLKMWFEWLETVKK